MTVVVLGCANLGKGSSYRLGLPEACAVYAPTAAEFAEPVFIQPKDLEIQVTNAGKVRTGDLTVSLQGPDADLFEVSPGSIPCRAPDESAVIAVKVPKGDPRGPRIYRAELLVSNANVTGVVPITYTAFTFIPIAVSFEPETLSPGASARAVCGDPGKPGKPWFSSDARVAVIDPETGALTATGNGSAVIGFIAEEHPLTVKGRKITVGSANEGPFPPDVRSLIRVRPEERQIAWQRMGFTAFLHFGMNTFTDREWGTGTEDPKTYRPARLDTDQWCETLQAAGIKAVIITAKHHDGFCLWNTKQTTHSVMYAEEPYRKDVVKLLSESCKKYGLKMGFYLSPWDMHEPTYASGKAYDDFFCAQLEELLTSYGEIYSVWFDGANGAEEGKRQTYDWPRYWSLIRTLQPSAAISNVGPDAAWIGNEAGEVLPSQWCVLPARMFDGRYIQSISQQNAGQQPLNKLDPKLGNREFMLNEPNSDFIWYPFEADVSIRPGWFFHASESPKSLKDLLNLYERTAGGNVQLLLNIPPDKDGRINQADAVRLNELGTAIRNIFGANLLDAPGVTARQETPEDPDHPVAALLKDDESYWRPAGETEQASIEIALPKSQTITHITLEEQIRVSQRIEAFTVQAKTKGGDWREVYAGTTVGFKKICRLASPVQANAVRIQIQKSRLYPTLRFAGVYCEASGDRR
ncbi:MAG: alpha-L-fucosidase [Spirochaetaceae bacterium]|nr:alpha-L-fucosidase [Spirochaetaceae bacterium]